MATTYTTSEGLVPPCEPYQQLTVFRAYRSQEVMRWHTLAREDARSRTMRSAVFSIGGFLALGLPLHLYILLKSKISTTKASFLGPFKALAIAITQILVISPFYFAARRHLRKHPERKDVICLIEGAFLRRLGLNDFHQLKLETDTGAQKKRRRRRGN